MQVKTELHRQLPRFLFSAITYLPCGPLLYISTWPTLGGNHAPENFGRAVLDIICK